MSAPLALEGLERCIHCGLCLEACPTYRITRLETESPRGRLHLMGAIAAGRVDAAGDGSIVHLDRCLACRACEVVCPSGVPYGRLIEETRGHIAGERGIGLAARAALAIVIRPRLLDAAAAVFSFYHRSGLRRLMRRLLPRGLRRLDALAPPGRQKPYQPVTVHAPRETVALLQGCVMRAFQGEVHTATARTLARAGVAIAEMAEQACCGALHAHAGDRDAAVALAKRNIAAFEASGAQHLVVNAAGCGAHLKSYAHLLEGDADWRERARSFAAKVRDITEYLAAATEGTPLGELRMRVTYQDPCHLAHAQGVRAEPRALLRAVRGLSLVEMADADVCCGSAGYYNITQRDYAERLLGPKVDAILATRPDAVVTANPGCMFQLAAGLRERGRDDIPVLHVVEVLDRATRAT